MVIWPGQQLPSAVAQWAKPVATCIYGASYGFHAVIEHVGQPIWCACNVLAMQLNAVATRAPNIEVSLAPRQRSVVARRQSSCRSTAASIWVTRRGGNGGHPLQVAWRGPHPPQAAGHWEYEEEILPAQSEARLPPQDKRRYIYGPSRLCLAVREV